MVENIQNSTRAKLANTITAKLHEFYVNISYHTILIYMNILWHRFIINIRINKSQFNEHDFTNIEPCAHTLTELHENLWHFRKLMHFILPPTSHYEHDGQRKRTKYTVSHSTLNNWCGR